MTSVQQQMAQGNGNATPEAAAAAHAVAAAAAATAGNHSLLQHMTGTFRGQDGQPEVIVGDQDHVHGK